LCGVKLDEIRHSTFPAIPRYAQKFCSKTHMVEYSKRKRIRKERFGEINSVFMWPTKEGDRVFRSDIKVSKMKNGSLEEFALEANKSRFDSRR